MQRPPVAPPRMLAGVLPQPRPQGDPKFALLRFDTTAGEYWDMSGGRGITFLVKAAKAYLTGNGYAQDGGSSDTNQKVTLE